MKAQLEKYSFHDFITDLELVTTAEPEDAQKIKIIARKMRLLLNGEPFLTESETQPHADRYARHLVHVDRERRFIVVSLVWGPGQGTPIHDHQTWGVAGVVRGELRIANFYRLDDGSRPGYAELREASAIVAPPGLVSYVLPPNEEIHQMENPTDEPTISLHVYGKEIFECNMYDLKNKSYKTWQLGYQNISKVER
jgi:predicted metal-dependent enzyme (double-stranded beta helix superfamily)